MNPRAIPALDPATPRLAGHRTPFVSRTPQRDAMGSRVTGWDQLHVSLIAAYLTIAGIFWFSTVSTEAIANTKIVLFASIVVMGLVNIPRLTSAQAQLIGWLTVCAIGALFTGLATDTPADAGMAMMSFMAPVLWLVGLCGVNPAAYPLLFRRLRIGLALFMLVAIYPVLAFAGLLPVMAPPPGFIVTETANTDTEAFRSLVDVIAGGFNGSRTGWGVTIAQTSLLLVALVTSARQVSNGRLFMALAVIAAAMASIVVTGARGGSITLFLLSIYALLGRINLSPGQRASVLIFAVAGSVAAIAVGVTIVLPQDYFRGLDAGGGIFDKLNSVTTGRMDTYVAAWDNFLTSPLFGIGVDRSYVLFASGDYLLPHNVWLRFLSQAGLLVFVPMVVATVKIVSLTIQRVRAQNAARRGGIDAPLPDTTLVILCGLLLAFSEPSVLFGTMNSNVMFWTAVWIASVAWPKPAAAAMRPAPAINATPARRA